MIMWKSQKLNDLCNFSNGLWKGKKPPFQNVGVIRNTNFTKDGKLNDTNIVYLEVEQSQFAKRKLQYGDIILEKSGGGTKQPVGRVIVFDKTEGDFSFSNFTSVVRIKDFNEVDFTFLHRFLFFAYISGATETMQSHSTGIRNLKFDEYKNINIPLPPLPEQKRIVAILDKTFAAIDKAITNTEKNLQNTKELFDSYLNEIFSNPGVDWEEKKLEEIGTVQTGTTPPTNDKSNYGDFIPFVKPAHFSPDGSIDSGRSMLSEKGLKKGRLFAANSVLMVCIGATIGKTGFSKIPVSSNQQINALTPSKFYESKFLYYALISPFVQRQVMLQGRSAQATLPIINKSKWGKLNINILNNKNKQKQIVTKLDSLSAETKRLESKYQLKLNNLKELKQSILQKAFNGEL